MKTIAEKEGEFSTQKIQTTKSGNLYYIHENGGSRGAHDCRGGDGVWRDSPIEPARAISREQAEEYLISWGYDPDDLLP